MSIIRLTEIKSDLSSRDLWINTAHIVCFETIPDLNRGEMYERPAFGRISTTKGSVDVRELGDEIAQAICPATAQSGLSTDADRKAD